jgi:hypothetical protein
MTRDRPRAGTSAGISDVVGVLGAGTAIAGNETGEFMVSPGTAANPTCERKGVTARPANGIRAAVKSAADE